MDDALFRIGIEFPTEEDRADMRAELGLDRPLPVQYLDWLGDALRGDLGRSYIGNKDIAQELMTRLPITLKVSLAAMLAAVVFGVGGGVLMAACHGTWLDTVLKGLSTLLLSVPGFWLALFLITVFAEWLHLLPTSGLDRGLASLVLPAVALSAANVGSTSRFTRGNILAQLGEQYIVVANAKGLSQRAVMVGHAFRNSLVPIITLIGNYFGGILGGSTIIENIFAIPGLGSYVLSAIQNRDYSSPAPPSCWLRWPSTCSTLRSTRKSAYRGERHDKTPETEHQAGPRVRHPGGHCPHDHLRPLAGPL